MTTTEPRTPSRRTLVLLVAPLVVLTIIGWVATALTPTLVKDHPLLLIAREPRLRNFLAAAHRVDIVPFMLVAVFRRFLSDPLYFLLGHFYGENAVRWIERRMGEGGGMVRAAERVFARWSTWVVFWWPGALVCALAGATGMRVRRFVILNVLGTITTAICIRLLAEVSWVEDGIDAVLRFNDRNVKWLTVASIAITVIWILAQTRQGKGEVQSIGEIERELGRQPDEVEPSDPQ